MYENFPPAVNDRPRGALEVSARARVQEKNLALIVANYQTKKKMSQKKGLLASIFAIFRAI